MFNTLIPTHHTNTVLHMPAPLAIRANTCVHSSYLTWWTVSIARGRYLAARAYTEAWRDTWYTLPVWILAHCLPDPREVPQVGISGPPCYTPCHALLGLPKYLEIGLDHVVMLGFSSLLGRLHDRGEWFRGYRVWDLGNVTFSLEPWHALGMPCRLHFGPKTR